VLLLVGAVDLGIEHLLLTAVAPRLVAAVGPDDRPAPPPTLLSVLERADALTIRRKPVEQPAAAVVPITAGATPRPVRSPSMQQAGA
jgi:predicted component of type VI protein secretion system